MIDNLSQSLSTQAATATPDDPTSGHEIDEASRSRPQQTETAVSSDDDDEWFNAEESHTSSAEIPNNAAIQLTRASSKNGLLFSDLRAQLEMKNRRVHNPSQPAQTTGNKTANINGHDDGLMQRLRRTLDPRSIYSADSSVLIIARDLKRDYNRVSKKVLRQREALVSSQQYQETKKLHDKAIEVTKLTANNKRLRQRVLSLELGQQSSVQEVENIREAAKQREAKLKEQKKAADNWAAQAVSQREYDSLRRQFDTILGELNQFKDGRQAEPQQTSTSSVATMTDDVQLANEERIAVLEQQAVIRDQQIMDAETRAQDASTRAQDAQTKAHEAETRAQEAQTQVQVAQAKVQEAETRAQGADTKAHKAEENYNALQHESRESKRLSLETNQQLQQRLQTAEEALANARDEAGRAMTEYTRNATQDASVQTDDSERDRVYQQGFEAAVRQSKAEVEVALADVAQKERRQAKEQAEAAFTHRHAELTAQFNTDLRNAVTRAEAPLRAELNAALSRAVTAEGNCTTVEASYYIMENNAKTEWQRAQEAIKNVTTEFNRAQAEYHRAQAAEEEVKKFKKGKASQDVRIDGHLAEIQRLKRLIPQNAALMAAEVDSTTGDRQRAHALIDEFIHRAYDWDARRVLIQLLYANERLIEFECLLKDPKKQPSQIECHKVLLDAEVDTDLYTGLNVLKRQVLVKQCKAVNMRLNGLKTLLNKSERPNKETLLTELYQSRGDELAMFDDEDPPTESSSDEDEDESSSTAPKNAPRGINVPTSRRPATVPQVQIDPSLIDARVNNDLKRKGSPDDDEGGASNKRKDATQMEMRPIAGPSGRHPQQGSSSPKAADASTETKPESQNEASSSSEGTGEAAASQQQKNDQTDLSPQLPDSTSPQLQHSTSPYLFASSETPSHVDLAPHPKSSTIAGPKPKPHLTASERQQRLRYRKDPDNEAPSAQEAIPPTSVPTPTGFSFSMPKSIASGIRPHVRKYTRLSGMTNIVHSRRQSAASNAEP